MRRIFAVTLSLIVFAIVCGASVAQATTPTVHEYTLDADSHCDFHTGHVMIVASFINDGSEDVSVTATDITFAGGSEGPITVVAGTQHIFTFDAGVGPLPGGLVQFDLVWENGDTESVTAQHSPTNGCGPTPTPTTPPPSTTTTPPPTTSTPPPTTTTTTTSSTPPPTTPPTHSPRPPKCMAHPDSDRCHAASTVTPPPGTAFTGPGPEAVVYGSAAILLLTLGTGLLWAARRRP